MSLGAIDRRREISPADDGWTERVRLRPFDPGDALTICEWVNERGELQMISSERDGPLTPEIVGRWIAVAAYSFVFELGGEIVAFATASTQEAKLPEGMVEICHLAVSPGLRRRYHGSFFCRWMARVLDEGGYKTIVGRAVPGNEAAFELMRYLRWKEVGGDHGWTKEGGCRWFAAFESRKRP